VARLILAYQRIRNGYNGRLLHTHVGTPLCTFMQADFAHLIEETALALKRHTEVTSVAFERTERAGIPIYVLTDEELDELRENPKAFAEKRSPEAIRVVVRDATVPSKKFVVRAGYDTLADAFGDDVYIRRVEDKVECPCCGRWAAATTTSLLCSCMQVTSLPLSQCLDRWAVAPLEHLLIQRRERYYLPRAWNTSGPWISHKDLTQKLLDYRNEKENAHDGRK
jgi:hypothetical protein